MGNAKWRTELTDVEKSADELWLGGKFQSNTELAGSPRNALRRSGDEELSSGKALFRRGLRKRYQVLANSEYSASLPSTSETVRDKLHCQEGNSPDHQLRPPNDR